MESIKLAIFTHDIDYGIELGEALSIFRNNFIVKVFEDISELETLYDSKVESGFDLLLLELDTDKMPETVLKDIGKMSETFGNDKRIIRLTEVRADCAKDVESMVFVLYKFSAVQDLVADILLYYSLLCGKKMFSPPNENMKMIAFCSAKGGAGKTTVALGVGQALRRYYSKSVLYLNFEEVESTLLYMKKREGGLDLCAYLYYFLKPGGKKPDLEAFLTSDKFGVKTFVPGASTNELLNLDDEKMIVFLNEIENSGAFDYVLIDMGESFSERAKNMLNVCNKIVVISTFDGLEDLQEKRYIRCLQSVIGAVAYKSHNADANVEDGATVKVVDGNNANVLGGAIGRLNKNIITVYNKITEPEEVAFDGTSIYIEFDSDSFERIGEVIEISIDRDFGRGIKELVKKII